MRKNIAFLLLPSLLLAAAPAWALTAKTGYQATALHTSPYAYIIGGLDLHDGSLYFGQYTDILSLNLSTLAVTNVGTIDSNAGNAFVVVNPADGVVHTSFGTSYSTPFPSKTGYFDAGGVFHNQLDLDGVYDAAVNSAGQLYIVANPDGEDEDDLGDGSRIYQYNWANGAVTEVANVGGSSGGLAFDANDNLYYSAVDLNTVVRFDAAEVVAGGLDLTDAATVLNLDKPGYLAFDGDGRLLASNSDEDWDNHVGLYDVAAGTKLADVADGGGKLAWADGVIYTVDTNWDFAVYASTVYAVQAVPEPGSLALLTTLVFALAGLGVRRFLRY